MLKLQTEEFAKIKEHLKQLYPRGEDPWGLDIEKASKNMELIYPFYKYYFDVKVHGKEHVQDRPYIVVSNHTGQIAIDGMLIATAFALEIEPPRILRAMVERFFTSIPVVCKFAQEGGAVLGDRQNCINLLNRHQSVLVFPEGVTGIAKSTKDFYKLQKFTRGFYRLALSTGVEILPVSVVGAEEFFPFVFQAKAIAKMMGLPALPISANYFPMPSPVDIYIGEPIQIANHLNADSHDKEIDEEVLKIEMKIKEMISHGLEHKRTYKDRVNQCLNLIK